MARKSGLFWYRKRRGISELVATVLLVAITLIAGAALFGYVNGQAANSEKGIGNQYGTNMNFLNEKEVLTFASFSSNQQGVYLWVYNTGKIDLSGFSILVSGPVCTSLPCTSSAQTTTATFTCLYSGSCFWVDSSLTPSKGSCGNLTAANTPISAATSTTPAVPQSYLFSLGGTGYSGPCTAGSPLFFATTLSANPPPPPPPYSFQFSLTFQGQYGSQAATTKGN